MPDGMPRHHKRYVPTLDCIHRPFCLCFFLTKYFTEWRGTALEVGVKEENVAMIFQNEVTDRSCQLFFCFCVQETSTMFQCSLSLEENRYNQLSSQQSSVALSYIHLDYLCTIDLCTTATYNSAVHGFHDPRMNVELGKGPTRALHH